MGLNTQTIEVQQNVETALDSVSFVSSPGASIIDSGSIYEALLNFEGSVREFSLVEVVDHVSSITEKSTKMAREDHRRALDPRATLDNLQKVIGQKKEIEDQKNQLQSTCLEITLALAERLAGELPSVGQVLAACALHTEFGGMSGKLFEFSVQHIRYSLLTKGDRVPFWRGNVENFYKFLKLSSGSEPLCEKLIEQFRQKRLNILSTNQLWDGIGGFRSRAK